MIPRLNGRGCLYAGDDDDGDSCDSDRDDDHQERIASAREDDETVTELRGPESEEVLGSIDASVHPPSSYVACPRAPFIWTSRCFRVSRDSDSRSNRQLAPI